MISPKGIELNILSDINKSDAEEHLRAARRLHNSNVRQYNTAISMFPASLLAGGRTKYEFFKADENKKADV